jgi:hypothetical protein
MYDYRSNPAIHQFLSSDPKNRADGEQFISNSEKELNERGTWFQVVIVHKET